MNRPIKVPAPSYSQHSGELIFHDQETGLLLYGHQFLWDILKTNKGKEAFKVEIEAEQYIALLQVRFSQVPEVRRYLKAVEDTGDINPDGSGELLEAVSDAIEVGPEDFIGDDQEHL